MVNGLEWVLISTGGIAVFALHELVFLWFLFHWMPLNLPFAGSEVRTLRSYPLRAPHNEVMTPSLYKS
eukprot:1377851-Amphidinium_carterae.1